MVNMNMKWETAVKAVVYFLLLSLALPLLIGRKITLAWVLGSAGISLVITVIPAYLIARLGEKKADKHTITANKRWIGSIVSVLKRKWLRVSIIAVILFILMAFIGPAVEGKGVDTAWTIISAITAVIGAVIGDYLDEKYKKKVGRW